MLGGYKQTVFIDQLEKKCKASINCQDNTDKFINQRLIVGLGNMAKI